MSKKISWIIILVIIFLSISYFFLIKNLGNRSITNNIKIFQLGINGYNRSSINLSIFRRNGLITIDNNQIITFFDKEGNICLVFRDLKNQNFFYKILPNKMPKELLGDGHMSLNLGYSMDGYLHLIYGAHATTPNYYLIKIDQPFDGKNITVVSDDINLLNLSSNRITYPQFFYFNHQLVLIYRDDEANSISINRYNLIEKRWSKWHNPLISMSDNVTVYLNNLSTRDSYVAIAFTRRLTPNNPNSNENIYLIYSEDGGYSWKNNNGKLLSLPIKDTDLQPIIFIPRGSNLINQAGSYLDSNLIFRIVYYKNNENKIPQIYCASFNLKKNILENIEQITTRNKSFELQGRGTLSLPISRPEIFEIDQRLFILYREDSNIWLFYKEIKKKEDKWKKIKLYQGNIKNWEPIIDFSLLNKNKLSLFIQNAEQGENDTNAQVSDFDSPITLLDVSFN